MAKSNNQKTANGSNLDFEAQLWAAADKMRGHMDASEYKHVCLGLNRFVHAKSISRPVDGFVRLKIRSTAKKMDSQPV